MTRSPPTNPIVMIPSRMASTRLPGKPLADINGTPMIVHVWQRAMEAEIGDVVVAAAEAEIVAAITRAGGRAVMTDPALPSGSDRIHQALDRLDPNRSFDAVINVQGDLPTLEPDVIRTSYAMLADAEIDIATLATPVRDAMERDDPNVVKAIVELPDTAPHGRGLYFTRATAPFGSGPILHHIGLYAYRRDALERFVAAPPGALEQREKLEQLRALALGMRIEVGLVDTVPLGVDTPADLGRARAALSS